MRTVPKCLEKLFHFFPAVHICSGLFFIAQSFILNRPTSLLWALFCIYLLPIGIWSFFKKIFGAQPGSYPIGLREKEGNIWVLGYSLQFLFAALPMIEKILLFFPGVYSAWLRLWGSQIGKGVVWTPGCEIVDRTHLHIGDYAFIGNKSYLSSHIIRRKNQRLVLLLQPVQIGSKALIGFQSQLGPGTVIQPGDVIPAHSQAMLGRIIRGDHDPANSVPS